MIPFVDVIVLNGDYAISVSQFEFNYSCRTQLCCFTKCTVKVFFQIYDIF